MNEAFAESPDAVLAARKGVVDIMVAPTDADLRVVARANPFRPYYVVLTLLARLGAGALFAGLTILFLWATQPELDTLTLASTALAAGVVGIAAFRFAIEREWKRLLAREAVETGAPYRLIGDGQSITVEDADALVRISLESIRRVVETPQHIIIVGRSTPVLALPRTAFRQAEIATAFAGFLRGRIASDGSSNNRDLP